MARGAIVFYIDSGTPQSPVNPVPANITDAQPLDIIISKNSGEIWQKQVNTTWSLQNRSRAGDKLDLSSDNIIPNVSPKRGAHTQDFNRLTKALQEISVNRYGDRYFNQHFITDSTFVWECTNGQVDLTRDTDEVKFTLKTVSNSLTISSLSANISKITQLLYGVYVHTNILDVLDITSELVTVKKQLQSTVAVYPPFIVASTAKVLNLNVDLFDDVHKDAGHFSDGSGINADKLDGLHFFDILKIMIKLPSLLRKTVYSSAATYTFTVPANASNMDAMLKFSAVGGGGASMGWHDSGYGTFADPGGPGGSVYDVMISAVPGEVFEIIVGRAGDVGGFWRAGSNAATDTSVRRVRDNAILFIARGGATASTHTPGAPGSATIYPVTSGTIGLGTRGREVGGHERGYDAWMDGIAAVGTTGLPPLIANENGLSGRDGLVQIEFYDLSTIL